MITPQTTAPPDTDRSNGHHAAQDTEQIALAIFDNLMSDTPTYGYDLAATGKYKRLLEQIVTARKVGLEPAIGVVESIKLRPDSELAQLLARRERFTSGRDDRLMIPPLPESAQLPGGYLPSAEDPKNWYAQWNDSKLREVFPLLADYIKYSHRLSPEGFVDFHTGCALWSLSTVAARRIYVPLVNSVYSPLAIAMVARTSLFAKTTTANVGLKVLRAAGLGWLLGDDETTPQKLMADMAGYIPLNYQDMDFDQKLKIEQRLAMSGQLGWYYDEFNQLIDAMTRANSPMAEFAGFLRKLDNCQDEYRYSTKGGGQLTIKQPYLALLANTTPANLRKHATRGGEFWNDGFWARFVFITPPRDAWTIETMGSYGIETPTALTDRLRDWNKELGVPTGHIEEIIDEEGKRTGRYRIVRGDLPSHPVMIEPEAYQAYNRYRVATKEMIGRGVNEDLDGSYSRLSDKALRVAALVASLEHHNRIDLRIWELAQEIAEMFRRNLHELYSQVSSAPDENPVEVELIDYLKTCDCSKTVREIMQRAPLTIRRLKAEGIRNLLLGFEGDGIIECKREGKKELFSIIQQ